MFSSYSSQPHSYVTQPSSHERSGSPSPSPSRSTSPSPTPYRPPLPPDARVASTGKSRIDGTDDKDEADNAAELKSINKKPRVSSKPKSELTIRDLFPTTPAPDTTTVLPSAVHASDVEQTVVDNVVTKDTQAPAILPGSEPVLADRTSMFMLTVSATIGLSMPLIMLLGPKDLAGRAWSVGVAALAGVFLGGVYVMGSKVIQLRDEAHARELKAGSPA